jgi:hypothetical protein
MHVPEGEVAFGLIIGGRKPQRGGTPRQHSRVQSICDSCAGEGIYKRTPVTCSVGLFSRDCLDRRSELHRPGREPLRLSM